MSVVNISKHRTPVDSVLIKISKVCIYINRHNKGIVTHANCNVTVKSIKININIKYYVWHMYRIRNLDTNKERERKQLNIFERKVYRRILGLAYDNEKENWRILTNKEIYAGVKKPTIIRDKRVT
jgi:hypothetical protein